MHNRSTRCWLVPGLGLSALIIAGCAGTQQTASAPPAEAKPAPGGQQMVMVDSGSPAKPAPAAAPVGAPPSWQSPKTGGGAGAGAAVAAGAWTAVVNGEQVPAPSLKMGDDATVRRIIDEGVNRSQVMQRLKELTDIGPRLTGSTRIERADAWARSLYTKWGLTNVHREQWGTIATRFDRGPSFGRLIASDGSVRELQFTTLSWTKGTNGPLKAKVVRVPGDEKEYEAVKDQVKGAWVIIAPSGGSGQRGVRRGLTTFHDQARDYRDKVAEAAAKGEPAPEAKGIVQMAIRDGAAGFISSSGDERVWTGGANRWRTSTVASLPPDLFVQVRKSDLEAIEAAIADNKTAQLEFNLNHTLVDGPIPVYNTIAEIRGTEKPDEVVIISAHMDSWDGPGSQGTTDNGTGTSVTLEAARLLIAAGAKPKRTIRFIHWTGEEQGLLGARAYVEKHADAMAKVSACFVDDGGTNSQGGLPCIESMKDMLAAATAPVNGVFTDSASGKPLTCNVRVVARMPRGGSSDHAAFNAVGVPGFFWDEVGRADYGYGWHTQNDKYELGIPEYLMQSATNSAVVAYRLACAETLLPREPKATEGETPDEPDRPRRPQGAGAAAPGSPAAPAAPTAPAAPKAPPAPKPVPEKP
ncbi:MAG: M20/M25/M40 family metallo-hydrolase [Phycisphaerae bacterium]|nr:M20/M25/M40 family metallo-hydrolase [Phycisphaerae bacterium]